MKDEKHLIMNCRRFKKEREALMNNLNEIIYDFEQFDNDLKFQTIIKSYDYEIFTQVTRFLMKVVSIRGCI